MKNWNDVIDNGWVLRKFFAETATATSPDASRV